jgi:NitT/TauT family transport system substrate-binding protein
MLAGAAATTGVLAAPAIAQAPILVTFGTNWKAQAEHGGFYQSVADGTYKKLGLDVRIVPGGPNVNNRALLTAGSLDFFMGGSLIQPFAAVEQGIPTVVVASMFQKEPQALLTHPHVTEWDALKTMPLLISRTGEASFFRWLIAEHGFSATQVRPYTFNAAPFCADSRVGQQGYVTAEPFGIERACGIKPNVFLLADHGYDTYSTLIECRRETIASRESVVQRFVDGSILGWMTYLYGDASPGNALIKQDNADMSDDHIAYSMSKMKQYGIVDSGDSIRLGVGAMVAERVESFYRRLRRAGVIQKDLPWAHVYDPRFVNKGVGNALRRA